MRYLRLFTEWHFLFTIKIGKRRPVVAKVLVIKISIGRYQHHGVGGCNKFGSSITGKINAGMKYSGYCAQLGSKTEIEVSHGHSDGRTISRPGETHIDKVRTAAAPVFVSRHGIQAHMYAPETRS